MRKRSIERVSDVTEVLRGWANEHKNEQQLIRIVSTYLSDSLVEIAKMDKTSTAQKVISQAIDAGLIIKDGQFYIIKSNNDNSNLSSVRE